MKMDNNTSGTVLNWADVIVVFNSLIRNIEFLREAINSGKLNDDELYDVEEELNDYVTLLARLRQKYFELSDKGELSKGLAKKLKEIC
jgi:hypothetical protein